ncbi:MAG: hypothetical protein ACI9N9_002842 [Enterobacterales bacterium]|jgi:hypothetical protein
MKSKISINKTKTLSLGCIIMALSTPVLASEGAGYVVTGDHKNGFLCNVTNGISVQDITLNDLDLAVGGSSDFKSIAQYYEMFKNKRMQALVMSPIINRHDGAFSTIQRLNPNVEMRPLMHTKAVRCEIKAYAYPKHANILSIITPEKMSKSWERQTSTTDSQSVTLSTSSTSKITNTQTASANLGFSYKGVSGGVSASTSKTSEQSLSSDFEQSTKHQNSLTDTETLTLEIPKGEFFGYAPASKNLSYEVEVTFESTFSGYVAWNYNPAVGGHHYYGSAINSILGHKYSNDLVHLPPRYTTTRKITTKVNKVIYQPAKQWQAFTNQQEFQNNYDALLHNHFQSL